MWADPRRLADDGHVDMVDAAAALFDQRACMLRKARGGGAAPLRIAGREMVADIRSEEHTSELQSLMLFSYAVFCSQNKSSTLDPSSRSPHRHSAPIRLVQL